MAKKRLDTVAVHAGQETADPATGSRAVPIYQTTSYVFKSTEHAANLFALKELGNIYTRIMNPTTDVFEKRVAAIEGGTGALSRSLRTSSHITSSTDNNAGWRRNRCSKQPLRRNLRTLPLHLPKTWQNRKIRGLHKTSRIQKSHNPKTRAIYAETIGNPKLDVPDFEAIAKIAHDAGIPLVVDNTVGVGLVRPIDYGADIIVDSATKYIGGHGTSIGGVIVDSGKFKWNNGKFPEFTEPDPSYHGLKYWDAFGNFPGLGNVAFIFKVRVQLLRDLGPALSPFNSWLFLQGLETLPLRQRKHSENALKVATYLKTNPLVSWVNYPGLPDNPNHKIAAKYLKNGYGGLVGFGIKGGLEAGKKFIESVQAALALGKHWRRKKPSHPSSINNTSTINL